jgi:hypothetical protein
LQKKIGIYLCECCPREFIAIYDHIRQLTFRDRPDYDLIRTALLEVVERKDWSLNDPYDWQIDDELSLSELLARYRKTKQV